MQREATAMTVRQNLGELLNGVQYRHDQIVITKAGKPVAALVDMTAFEKVRESQRDEFGRLWAKFSKGFEDLTEEQVMELATEAVAEARAQIKARKAAGLPPRGEPSKPTQ